MTTRACRAVSGRLSLAVQPINLRDRPNYFLNRAGQAAEIIDKVGAPNVKMQFDFYHLQIAEGDLMTPPIWSNVAGENSPVLRDAL